MHTSKPVVAFVLAIGLIAVAATHAWAQCRQTTCNQTPAGYVCRCS
jgi:hypothetical protein